MLASIQTSRLVTSAAERYPPAGAGWGRQAGRGYPATLVEPMSRVRRRRWVPSAFMTYSPVMPGFEVVKAILRPSGLHTGSPPGRPTHPVGVGGVASRPAGVISRIPQIAL